MKIIYIHQHFVTNEGTSGTRSYDVSKYMVKAGHQVHMICGVYDLGTYKRLPWYRFFKHDVIDGVNVTVCNVYYSNKLGGLRRTWSFLYFAFLATIAALRIRKPNLVFATSTPLTVGIPGYVAGLLKRIPFVFEVRDLWPESFVRSGWVKGTELSIRMMGWLEVFLYNRAKKILLVSSGFEKRLIERGFPPSKLKTILLGADGELFRQIGPDAAFFERHGLVGKKVAIYTGAHGKANGLDYVVEAASFTRDRSDLAFLLVGDGSEKNRLKQLAVERGLINMVFADPVPKEKLTGILALCSFGLMILKYIGEGRPVTPNKIFDYMFVGIPAMVNFEGPTWDMVREDNCGYLVDPTNPKDLADKLKTLADDPALCRALGEGGKKAAWQKYDRKIIAEQLLDVFKEAVGA